YSITLDPEKDTPEVLDRYARAVGAGPGWKFLTGKPEAIDRLRRRLGLYDPDPVIDADKTQHAGIVVYGNAARAQWSATAARLKPASIVALLLRVADPR